jgi:hypothetical protein
MRQVANIIIADIEQKGLLRELNPGPLAPEARIMPLDQAASCEREGRILPSQWSGGMAMVRARDAIVSSRSEYDVDVANVI